MKSWIRPGWRRMSAPKASMSRITSATPPDRRSSRKLTVLTAKAGTWGSVSVPGMDRAAAEALVTAAHEVCPYSNATRGNVEVALTVV